MTAHRTILIVVFWIASLVAVGAWSQSGRMVRPGSAPEVLNGSDLGFQIQRWNGDTPVGVLVVKKDGRWVEVEFGSKAKLAR